MERYREDQYGAVYEYNEEKDAYLFVGKKIGDEKMSDVIDRVAEAQYVAEMDEHGEDSE